jgi:hypothetical protein
MRDITITTKSIDTVQLSLSAEEFAQLLALLGELKGDYLFKLYSDGIDAFEEIGRRGMVESFTKKAREVLAL